MKNVNDYVLKHLGIFNKLYDEIKIIDPAELGIVDTNLNSSNIQCNFCLEKYGKQKACENCITARAVKTNDTVVKFEYIKGKPTRMTATPLEYNGKQYIVEFIKYLDPDELYDLVSNDKSLEDDIRELNLKLVHDGLTGIYNRRYIDETLPLAINASYKYEKSLTIIMSDLDMFKQINDTYGHQVGDTILIEFAQIMNRIVNRYNGWVARYGGEEFLCVLMNININEAYDIAEEIRKTYAEKIFQIENHNIKSTASFGIAELSLCKKIDSNELIKAADDKLYYAKHKGRNLIII